MSTAIAMVGYANADDILTCLDALGRSTDTDYSVHICENGGPDATSALVTAVQAIASPDDGAVGQHLVWAGRLCGGQPLRILTTGANLGYAGGVNVCIRDSDAAGRAYVWVLNPDTEPAPSALEHMRRHAASGPYGIVGCRLVLRDSGLVQLYGGRWRAWLARGFNIGLGAPAGQRPDITAVEAEMTYINGASMLVSQVFLDDVGPMDERYFLYNEEVDWCFRRGCHRLGYAHDAVVIHTHGSTIGSSANKRQRTPLAVYLDERNKLLFTRRFHPRLYPLVVLTTLILATQYLRHGALRNFTVALRGWRAGLRGETGAPEMVTHRRPSPQPDAKLAPDMPTGR